MHCTCGYVTYEHELECRCCKARNVHYKAPPSSSPPPKEPPEAPTMCLGCLYNQALPNTKFCEQCSGPPSKRYKGEFMHSARALYDEAFSIVSGPRRDSYGNQDEAFGLANFAKVTSAVLGVEVTAKQMALVMIGCKLCREANKHSHDNLVDLCGYAGLLAELEGMV